MVTSTSAYTITRSGVMFEFWAEMERRVPRKGTTQFWRQIRIRRPGTPPLPSSNGRLLNEFEWARKKPTFLAIFPVFKIFAEISYPYITHLSISPWVPWVLHCQKFKVYKKIFFPKSGKYPGTWISRVFEDSLPGLVPVFSTMSSSFPHLSILVSSEQISILFFEDLWSDKFFNLFLIITDM